MKMANNFFDRVTFGRKIFKRDATGELHSNVSEVETLNPC